MTRRSRFRRPVDNVDWTERMTGRARGYLLIAATRHLFIGVACIFFAGQFTSPAYRQIEAVLPIPAWGWLFIFVSVVCFPAAIMGNGNAARAGLILSAASTAVWAGGFIAAIWLDVAAGRPVSGPTGVVVFLAVAAKDLVVCRNPMRSPFEDLGQRIVEAETRAA